MLEKFYEACVLAAISNTEYEGEIKAYGDTVNIRTIPDITIRDYTIGMNLNYERPEAGIIILTIDQGKYFAHAVNQVEKKQADIAYVSKWAEDASQGMKIAIDTQILADIPPDAATANEGTTAGVISASVNLGTTGTAGESAVVINKDNVLDQIIQCGQVLDEQNVPETGRWFVIPAWMAARIKGSDLKDVSMTGDGKSVLRNGRIGMIDRFELFSSNLLSVSTETSTKCYSSIFGHKTALTFASQLVENETLKNPVDFGDLIRGLQVFGYKVLHPESLGHLYCRPGNM